MNILLIEPNHSLAETYRRALEQAGHHVDWQPDGQGGVLAADRQTPDAVILELQLPGHSGVEFLYEFRSYPEWQRIPVIVQSLVPDTYTAAQKQQFGIIHYLYKPATSLGQLLGAANRLSIRV